MDDWRKNLGQKNNSKDKDYTRYLYALLLVVGSYMIGLAIYLIMIK